MIFRPSQRLATKLKLPKLQRLSSDSNPFADWSAHHFLVGRSPYVILTNTASLFSVVLQGTGLTTVGRFVNAASNALQSFLEDDGLNSVFWERIAPSTASVQFATALNRSVTGSMNDLILGAKLWLSEDDLPLSKITAKLNETPLSYLDYRHPREVFVAMARRQ